MNPTETQSVVEPVQPPRVAPDSAPAPKAGRGTRRRAGRFGLLASVQSLASTVVIALFVITFLFQAFQIPSVSMEQTLLVGDYLLVDKVHYGSGGVWRGILPYDDIGRGDIVVFRYPINPEQHFVKRVIAVPGDHVRLVAKRLFVNGRPATESYAIHKSPYMDVYRDNFPQPGILSPSADMRWWVRLRELVRNEELVVPPGSYFVLGDNRDESLDSRYWGLVPRENIIGRPLVIYLSLASAHETTGGALAADGKLKPAGVLNQLMHMPRWNRTFRIVR